ncbi:MAG TPA: hypothetical protein VF070_23985 [Streptosporangiaceae bacterium]
MTSHDAPAGSEQAPPRACRRPGCTRPLPAHERGRSRQFCSDECARRYHNDARIPPPRAAGTGQPGEDPLTTLDALLRQAAACAKTAREQAAALDPAQVRAQIADAEAARRRAEAAAVTAAARQAEAEAEAQALTDALAAARDDTAAAQAAAQQAAGTARAAAAELGQLHHETATRTAAIQDHASEQVTTARQAQARAERERDDALATARQARVDAATEITRARQAETDARAETARVRDDAGRERDALREHCQAQLQAERALTAAERARAERAEAQLETERTDRRTLTTHLTAAGDNGHAQPARHPRPPASGARSK